MREFNVPVGNVIAQSSYVRVTEDAFLILGFVMAR